MTSKFEGQKTPQAPHPKKVKTPLQMVSGGTPTSRITQQANTKRSEASKSSAQRCKVSVVCDDEVPAKPRTRKMFERQRNMNEGRHMKLFYFDIALHSLSKGCNVYWVYEMSYIVDLLINTDQSI